MSYKAFYDWYYGQSGLYDQWVLWFIGGDFSKKGSNFNEFLAILVSTAVLEMLDWFDN